MDLYTLPDLPYAPGALAPRLSEAALLLHHGKHHAAYVKAANEIVARLADAESAQVPALERSLDFNVSGHVLHSLLWQSMSPVADQVPAGPLAEAIDVSFGSYSRYLARFTAALTTIQGSGWALLMWEPLGRRLRIVQAQNHESSLIVGATAILAADAWEHAYYVDYKNDKVAWAAAFTSMTDWAAAGERFEAIAMVATPSA